MGTRHHNLLCNGLSTILNEDKFVDFQIRTSDGTSLPCHRVIMAAVSPFFERMLDSDMRETERGIVDLPFDTSSMRDILAYVYKGEIIVTIANMSNIPEIYYAANYLSIEPLIQDCDEFLTTELPVKTSMEIWQIAKLLKKDDIIEISKSKVLQDFLLLCNSDCMCSLNKGCLLELLQDSALNCSGDRKCKAAWLWVLSHDTDQAEVDEIVKALTYSKNVDNDNILSATANEENEELDQTGEELERAEEMWTNTCEKLWIRPASNNTTQRSAIVPYGNENLGDFLVILDEGPSGQTRLTFFDNVKKRWLKKENISNLELGHRYAVCTDGSIMYISGGNTRNRDQRRLLRFICGTGQCSRLRGMPVGRERHTMCRVDRYVYVLGGVSDDEPDLSDVHRYSLKDDIWIKFSTIACPVSQHSCVSIGNMIYLLGGCVPANSQSQSDTAQFFNSSTGISGFLDRPLPIKCKMANVSATVVRDDIYFLFKGHVYKLKPNSKAEVVCKLESGPQKGFAFVAFDNKVLAIGGEDDNFRNVRPLSQFDSQTRKAVKLPIQTPWSLQDFAYVKLQVPMSWTLDEI